MNEKSLMLIKPDAVERKLIGEITSRFEKIGLTIKAMKMLTPKEEVANNHYKITDEWCKDVFEKSKSTAQKEGRPFEHKDHIQFGKFVQSKNINFLTQGPIIAMIIEGPHAIEIIRKIVGHTEPKQALAGTIRGDLVFDSYKLADKEQRSVKNLIHASSDSKEAEREIKLWFNKQEIIQ